MEEIYLMNPRQGRKRSHKRAVHRKRHYRRNPGAELALLNPRRRKGRRHSRSNAGRRRHYRRNPGFLPAGLDLTTIGAGGAGAVGSRMAASYLLPLLGQVDTGLIGAVATIGAGFILSKAAGMLLKNKKLENGILLGAGIATLTRVVDDFVVKKVSLSEFAGLGLGAYLPDYSAGGGGSFTSFTPPGSRLESRFHSRF
jgi:hypothetical protein